MERRQLLPAHQVSGSDETPLQVREVGPFYYQASRGRKDLPYATSPNKSKKRDRELPLTPDGPSLKRRELIHGSESMGGGSGVDTEGTSRQASHADLNNEMYIPELFMSQATSEDFTYTQTSDSVMYEFPSSSPPAQYGSQFPSSPPGDNDDSACFVDEGDTTLKRFTQRIASHRSSFREKSTQELKADKAIDKAVEEGNPQINLSGFELIHVPDQVKDLNHIVAGNGNSDGPLQARLQLFLDCNILKSLSISLFTVTNLTVLVLRKNNLKTVSPAISQLINLVELSLSQNELEYLPSEILDLPKLSVFSVHPNPLLDAPALSTTKSPISPTLLKSNSRILYYTELHVPETPPRKKIVLSLVELCQLSIASAIHGKQDMEWLLDHHISQLVDEARNAYDNHASCGVCHRRIINGVGYCYEWRDAVHGQSGVVFKRHFCTLNCVYHWQHENSTVESKNYLH